MFQVYWYFPCLVFYLGIYKNAFCSLLIEFALLGANYFASRFKFINYGAFASPLAYCFLYSLLITLGSAAPAELPYITYLWD